MRHIDLIVVHCSATPPSMDWGAQDIDYLHRRQNGWSSIGYHYVIRRNGVVEDGRALEVPGAHVRGHNARSIGVCLVGGVDFLLQPKDNFTPEQKQTLRQLLERLRLSFPTTRICGHRDLSPDLDGDGTVEANEWVKACPSFDVKDWCWSVGIDPTRWKI